jgi:hypothetical protein
METRLADFLQVSLEEVAAARDWPAWLRRLLDDAGVSGMIVDEALHPDDPAQPRALYEQFAGRPVWKMARLDPLVDRATAEGACVADVPDAVERFMVESAAGARWHSRRFWPTGQVCTSIPARPRSRWPPAYRSAAAERPCVTSCSGRCSHGRPTSTCRSRCTPASATPTSDSPKPILSFWRRYCAPRRERRRRSCSSTVPFPWHQQAAYLASVRPNVRVELSLSNLFAPLGTAERLLQILDLAPRGRVLLGSDGHELPEAQWLACRVLNDAWLRDAAELAGAGARESWIEKTRTAMFEGNAREVYGLA